MYVPAAFSSTDLARIHEVVDRFPFGALVATRPDGSPEIAHLPFLLDRSTSPSGTLRFHLARTNPMRALLEAGCSVVAVFSGPDAYVSASWYEEPSRQVPTWNYIAVHAAGRPAPMERPALAQLLEDLARRHESPDEGAWRMDRLAPEFAGSLMDHISGFSLVIERLEAKFKLSQNRSPADRKRVRDALRAGGRADVASWMDDISAR